MPEITLPSPAAAPAMVLPAFAARPPQGAKQRGKPITARKTS